MPWMHHGLQKCVEEYDHYLRTSVNTTVQALAKDEIGPRGGTPQK